jgi:DNA-binding beta-propeller fold protein YncE
VSTWPRTRLLIVTLAAALAAIATAVTLPGLLRTPSPGRALPLRQDSELALPGGSTRFDYESLDPGRGLLFIAHLGDSQVIETDIRASRVVRVITGLADVHGVLVVPALIACDGNARLLTLNLSTWRITGTSTVGDQPDVLAYDPAAGRLYVAAESGDLTILDNHAGHLTVTGRAHLADGAHVVAVDPATHDSYYPIPAGPGGHPALLTYHPAP